MHFCTIVMDQFRVLLQKKGSKRNSLRVQRNDLRLAEDSLSVLAEPAEAGNV